MTTSNSVRTAEQCIPRQSSDPESPGLPAGLADLGETTPLLQTYRTHVLYWSPLGWWPSTGSVVAVSAFFGRNTGLLLVTASHFFYTAMNFSVKWLNSLDEPIPVLELIWVRMVVTYVCAVVYMFLRKVPDPLLGPKGIRGLLLLQGFSGFVGLSGIYFSLQHLSLSDATVLTFLALILTGFSGALFLSEPFSLRQTFSGVCSLFGVVLIARPPFLFDDPKRDPSEVVMPERRALSVAAGLLGVMGQTSVYTCLRAIGKRAHPFHSIMFFCFECVLASTLGMIIFRIVLMIPTDPLWLAMLLLIGKLGLTAQTLLAMGLQQETASCGTLAAYTSIVFATGLEFIVYHTTPPALSIAGTVIIMSSAIYTSLTKQTTPKPTARPTSDRPSLTNLDQNNDPVP